MKEGEIQNKNSQFQQFYEKIKSKKDGLVDCKIIEEKEDQNLKIKFMSISFKNEICHSFTGDLDDKNLKNKDINFEISNINIDLLNGVPYFHIKKYNIINKEYKFEQIKVYYSLDKIDTKTNDLCCLILKCKEIFQSLIHDIFIFEDLSGKKVNIEINDDYNFENGKLYVFTGYLYNQKKDQFTKTLVSSIKEYSSSTDKIYESNELNKIIVGNLVNFKAKIHSFNIKNTSLIIEDKLGNKYKVNTNFSLLKKITVNNEVTFYNFIKKTYKDFYMTNLSDIDLKEDETFIEFNILNNKEDNSRLYNYIKVEDQMLEIKENRITFKINAKGKKNIFIQTIYFFRKNEKKVTDSFEYSYEINKGKINHIDAFLGKGGFNYEFYIKALKKEDLPEKISIIIDNKTIDFKSSDNFSNVTQKRFIFANIPKQNLNQIFNYNKNIDSNGGKYLILINNKGEKYIQNFKKNDIYNNKENFNVPKNISLELKKLYQTYIIDESFKLEKYIDSEFQFPSLDIDNSTNKYISSLSLKILNGFNKLIFNNSKEDYDNVKYLSLIFICKYLSKAGNTFNNYISNFKSIIKSIVNLDYLDRIKVLITFIANYYDNLFATKLIENNKEIIKKGIGPIDDCLILVNLDDEKIINKYSYIGKAFEIIYKIVDGLSEECALFRMIQQFNSLILEETLSNSKKHSGSILNLNDIKLELIQNINRFIFISKKDMKFLESYSYFRDISNTVIINIRSIMHYFPRNKDFEFSFNNLVLVTFLLLLYESLGHKNKNINNEDIDSPRVYYGTDFEELSLNNSDTSIILELILFGRHFNLKNLMKNKNPFKLLDENLYLGKNFDNLKDIYSEIEKEFNNKSKIEKSEEEKEEEKEEAENLNLKKSGKKINLTDNDDEEEEEEENILLFHDLFAIYGDLNEEEKKKMKII